MHDDPYLTLLALHKRLLVGVVAGGVGPFHHPPLCGDQRGRLAFLGNLGEQPRSSSRSLAAFES